MHDVSGALSRRSLLAGLSAGVMGAAMSNIAIAAPRRTFFERIGKPIGLQLYTLGDELGKDLDAGFARLIQIGYRDFEVFSLYGKTPKEVRAAADKAGVKFSSMHLPAMQLGPQALSLLSEPQRIADDLGVLGISSVIAPIAPFPAGFRPSMGEGMQAAIARALHDAGIDGWKRTAQLLNERANALKSHGIQVGYHDHNMEFAPYDGGIRGWDVLMKECDPKLVKFEVDIGWVTAAGLDPVAFLTKAKGRVHWLHVKDLKATTKANFALTMDPTEVGSGEQNWAKVLPAARAAGVEHFYVEQEPPFAIARMEAAAKSFAYLEALRA